MNAQGLPLTEVCPSCGEFVAFLLNATGWCRSCSTTYYYLEQGTQTSDRYAQIEDYLAANANHLEHYMVQGHSLADSFDLMRNDRRPRCIVCGKAIPHGRSDSIFCKRTHECRRIKRRYIYLNKDIGLTKPEALAKILNELQ